MTLQSKPISFRGGAYVGLLPLATFVVPTATLVVKGSSAVEGIIMAIMLGISLGLIFTHQVVIDARRVKGLLRIARIQHDRFLPP